MRRKNIFKERIEAQILGEIHSDLNTTYDKMVSNLKKMAKSILGVSEG